ncbi:MAG TPA: hypothetical protein V6D06_02705 [Trichocoleus sp.]
MNRTIGAAAIAAGFLLTLGFLEAERHPQTVAVPVAQTTAPTHTQPALASSDFLPSQAYRLQQAVSEPLLSLPAMERAVAASDLSGQPETPLKKLLTAQLTTGGLGPLRLGMTVADAASAGIELVPLEGSSRGECQYMRIAESFEPIGLMVVDGNIIRIDVWPGSLVKTKSGAQIGSTEAEVRNYYKDRIETLANPATGGKYLVFTPSGAGEDLYRLVFETDAAGSVVEFRSGQFPAVTWPEGCF